MIGNWIIGSYFIDSILNDQKYTAFLENILLDSFYNYKITITVTGNAVKVS